MVNKLAQIRMKKLGLLIKDARLAAGKSINDCASILGITKERISAFESGKKPPSLPELESLAFFLDVPIAHFWGKESRFKKREEHISATNLEQFIEDRQKIIGELLHQARTGAQKTLKELAEFSGTTPRRLKSFEAGVTPIPIPELEKMISYLDMRIEEFQDVEGVVGEWANQSMSIQEFLKLPEDIQAFVTKPVNLPYLEIAKNLSGLSVEKLRTLAEGILEITF